MYLTIGASMWTTSTSEAEVMEQNDKDHAIFDLTRVDDPRGHFQTNFAVAYASGLAALKEVLLEDSS